jgi:Ser/Thr protein kinase RdoA (MazF antagonist)
MARDLTQEKIGQDRTDGFAELGRRAQLERLRRVARRALAGYGLEDVRLTTLRHEHNTTFRVDARGARYVVRITRPGLHSPATVLSEMAWLAALRRDTGLGVPEPVSATDGSLVVVVEEAGIPEPLVCVLLRWLGGRFADRRLAPVHLHRVGGLTAALQAHASTWTPPRGFLRPRVDTLTNEGRTASRAGSAGAARRAVHPTPEDGERARELVQALVSPAGAELFERGLERARATTEALAEEADGFGLVHGDLHYDNFLFHRGEARAIDFDDCGWGFHLYDLAVTLWELEERPRYAELHAALVTAYARERPLPRGHERHLRSLAVLRRLQMLMWILESREHPGFRSGWRAWAQELLDEIAASLARR